MTKNNNIWPIKNIFNGKRDTETVFAVQRFLQLSDMSGEYGSKTHNPILDYVKKHPKEFSEKLTSAVAIRDTVRKVVENYKVPNTLKPKMTYTARKPEDAEIKSVKNRLSTNPNWKTFFQKNSGKGVLIDNQEHTAYVVSGNRDNPIFHNAYTITLGENGVGSR